MYNAITELCKLGYKYGTDKCPQIKHAYTPFYFKLLNHRRQSIKKVLEIGVGHYKNMQSIEVIYDPGLNRYSHRATSLYMWRDFFPNAQIFGADVQPETIFEDERIKTFLCDERKEEDIKKLVEQTGSDIDLFIDDGSHHRGDQIFLSKTILPLLKKGVIYIIEDVRFPRLVMGGLHEYDCWIPNISRQYDDNRLMLVRNK